jgi:hypothetical protein
MKYLIFILIFLIPAFSNSQVMDDEEGEPDWADTTFTFDDLDDELIIELDEMQFSKGWFPSPFNSTIRLSWFVMGGIMYEKARNVNPAGFYPVEGGFNPENDLERDERELVITPVNEDGDEDNRLPESGAGRMGLDFWVQFKDVPVFPMVNLYYQNNAGLLINENDSKKFLSHGGFKKEFKEITYIHTYEHQIGYSGGILIPLWGAFSKAPVQFQTFYGLYGGYSGTYTYIGRTLQYSQIGNQKDQIAYGNGLDTLRLRHYENAEYLNRNRFYADIGLFVETTFRGVGFSLDFLFSVPLTNTLSTADWKQYRLFFGMGLEFRNP